MPLDQRLRDGLHRDADPIEPDVLAGLESVTRRASRSSGTTGRLMLSAAAIIVVLVLVRLAGVGPHIEVAPGATPSGATSRSPSTGDPAALVGTWTVTLAPADTGVGPLGMVGDWTMRLGADSTVEVVPPPGFHPPSGSDPGGYAYAVTGPSLVTNLFTRDFAASCAGSGGYTWSADDTSLRLTMTADTCEPRRVLLGTGDWTAVPAPTGSAAAH
ncbi:MAG: hypothetical protein LH650_05875 [Chloroflexi bacterium]|nr:hypothetical protein [Chloroflexota bacterium]